MSEKNKLQEYCQKNKLGMPVYKSWSDGNPHKLKWFASVTININNNEITLETTKELYSKTDAEKQAAAIMLNYINSNIDNPDNLPIKKSLGDPLINTLTQPNTIYLIDLENKPFFRAPFVNDNCLYIGFLNSIHHSVLKYDSWYRCESDDINQEIINSKNYKLLYLIDGGTADLVDHFMTMFVYPVTNYIEKYDINIVINIISGDHAGWCTRSCLEKILSWRKINNVQINNSSYI